MINYFSKLKKLPKTDIAAFGFLLTAFIYLLVMASFDGTISDEAFYISIPYRLINGDGLFTDEWHLSQLSAVLLYIPVRLFTALTGGTAGIILFIRQLFCIMQLIVGAYFYKAFRQYGFFAILISFCFMLFSVIGVNTLSYNTMGFAALIIIICLSEQAVKKPSAIKMFIAGSLIAMFILCQPVGIVFYGIYFLAVIIINVLNKNKNKTVPYPFTVKAFLFTVAGILPVLIFFLYLLLKNSDIETIIKCIPGILSDVEHMVITEELGIETFSLIQFFTDMSMSAGAVPLIMAAVIFFVGIFIKKKSRNIAVIISSFALAVFFITFYIRLFFMGGTTQTDDNNFFFLPLALAGIVFYLLSYKKNHRVFVLLWCTGILYALFMTISSNLGLHASVNGYIIASAGSLILAKDLFSEIRKNLTIYQPPTPNLGGCRCFLLYANCSLTRAISYIRKNETDTKKDTKAAAVILAVSVFGFTVFQAGTMFCEPVITRSYFNSTKMTNGIYDGINLPSDQALLYTNIYNDAQKIKEAAEKDDRLFVIENLPGMYLESGLKMGTLSGWFIAEQLAFPEIRARFREYYEINPENAPDYLYVPAYFYGEYSMEPIPAKRMATLAYNLFEGEAEDIGSGLLIRVTGIKDE